MAEGFDSRLRAVSQRIRFASEQIYPEVREPRPAGLDKVRSWMAFC